MAGGILPFQVSFRGVVRGYHVYKDIWNPVLNEELTSQQEPGNLEDHYAVAVIKGDVIVGHVPREISKTCYHFIAHDGEISCKLPATDSARYCLKED